LRQEEPDVPAGVWGEKYKVDDKVRGEVMDKAEE